ncbi:hypothetical protein BJ165DRAFT_1418672 [Panaeolus papilionaceus]|nr:hypothetical protein BJ165DRAFT_1418672 [Panaeolus papilionaceus]
MSGKYHSVHLPPRGGLSKSSFKHLPTPSPCQPPVIISSVDIDACHLLLNHILYINA